MYTSLYFIQSLKTIDLEYRIVDDLIEVVLGRADVAGSNALEGGGVQVQEVRLLCLPRLNLNDRYSKQIKSTIQSKHW